MKLETSSEVLRVTDSEGSERKKRDENQLEVEMNDSRIKSRRMVLWINPLVSVQGSQRLSNAPNP